MPRRKSTVKIENNKVVFSKEILEYLESLRNEETNEWVDKYIEVLSDTSNFNTPKYNVHHIKPVFTFKTEELNTRRKAVKIADKFNGNLIKLSIYNHILAHFYLWKIYNNHETKIPLNYLFKTSKTINELTEEELKETAKLIEEFSKTNKSRKEYYIENRTQIRNHHKNYYIERFHKYCFDPRVSKIKIVYWGTLYDWHKRNLNNELTKNTTSIEFADKYLLNEDDIIKYSKEINEFKNPIKLTRNQMRNRYCFDPRIGTKIDGTPKYHFICKWGSLVAWGSDHLDLINNLSPKEYANQYLLNNEDLIKYKSEITNFEFRNDKLSKKSKNKHKQYLNSRICFDPRFNKIKSDTCKIYKFTHWRTLYNWAKNNVNHELLCGKTPIEFSNSYILTDEELIKYKDEINYTMIKYKEKKSKEEIHNHQVKQRNRLCFDFRQNKLKFATWKTLYNWARNHPNHELIENLKPKEFANKYILSKEDKIKYADEIKEYLNRK